jgi:hypothetical protein
MAPEQPGEFHLDALRPRCAELTHARRGGDRRRQRGRPAIRDASLDDLLDPHHDIGARIDMAARKPPHFDEGARENPVGPMLIRHLTAQTARYQTRAPIEQLTERIAVIVGDPADQPPQPLRTIARAN